MYKHYSFDMWGTLIKPNEIFSKDRIRHFHIMLLKSGKMLEGDKIDKILWDVSKYYDAYCEMNGTSPSPLDMYSLALYQMQGHLKGVSPLYMELLYQELEKLFLNNPPAIYDEDTLHVLYELRARGKTLSILSNTGYIRGKTLDKVLDIYGIKDLFVFRLYSDEFNLSKPNKEFFRKVDKEVLCRTEDVIHVGDNELADRIGAEEYGFGSVIINSNDLTIKDLL